MIKPVDDDLSSLVNYKRVVLIKIHKHDLLWLKAESISPSTQKFESTQNLRSCVQIKVLANTTNCKIFGQMTAKCTRKFSELP